MHDITKNDQLTLRGIRHELEESTKTAAAGIEAVKGITRFLFALAMLLVSAPAAMGTMLLRRRIGLMALAVHGVIGLLLLGALLGMVRGPLFLALAVWFLAFFVALAVKYVNAVRRLYEPPPLEGHVVRWSLGEPAAPLMRIYARVLGRRARSGVLVALLGEAPLMLALALGLLALEGVSGGVLGRWSWVAPFWCAIGIAGQAVISRTRDAWQLMLVRDRQVEQQELASALARGGGGGLRAPDGFARIPW